MTTETRREVERGEEVLGQCKPALLELVRPGEPVVSRAWLTQERQRDKQHTGNGQHGADGERGGHIRTAPPA